MIQVQSNLKVFAKYMYMQTSEKNAYISRNSSLNLIRPLAAIHTNQLSV